MGIIGRIERLSAEWKEMLRAEKDMARAVEQHFNNSTRELRVGPCILDVTAYDKQRRVFSVIECKLGSDIRSIGQAFGQISAYYAALSALGRDFINEFTKRVPLRYDRVMEATRDNKLQVAFYVALTDAACEKIELIRSIKRLLPGVGIVRVKLSRKCRHNLKCNGRKDYKLAAATPTTLEILQRRSA